MNKILIISALALILFSCNNDQKDVDSDNSPSSTDPPAIQYSVLNAYPHDTTAYTEGLLIHQGQLYESTGHTDTYPNSQSLFGVVDLKTGKIETKIHLDNKKYFGEGICFLDGKVFQLTLDSPRVCFVYDAKTFKKLNEYPLNSQGWGLTTDGKALIRSDGSSNLYYHDPANFNLIRIVGVNDNSGPVNNLNELEYINGYIYANKWQTNFIYKIDPASGKVVGKANLGQLADEARRKYEDAEYMNGIAYDSAAGKVYITGKMWPTIYELKLSN
jgi:glutaminyl-peptide cyclotransferase